MPWLRREALSRVLQSLLTAEIERSKGELPASLKMPGDSAWPETLALGEDESPALGCDSLELLQLAAAVNEMFCLYEARLEKDLLAAATFGEWLDVVETGWNEGGSRMTFSSSGSTGQPKRCTHEMLHLEREVTYLAERFYDTRRVIALAPPHHIYGFLFTALLPTRMGVPVVEAAMTSPGKLMQGLRAGDALVSVPPRWAWLDRSLPRWPKGVAGITSTAPMDEVLKSSLVQCGLESLTEVYGSSETAGIGLRIYPEERYTLMPHWRWADLDGEAPMLDDGSGRRSPLQDHVEVAVDGSFKIEGRVDGAVQVGGTNVYPSLLERELRTLPGVAEAAVRLAANGSGGRLKAFVVPEGSLGEEELVERLQAWARTHPVPERVRSFRLGSKLPRTATGKLTDWQ